MAYIIGDIAVMPRIAKRTLSCMGETKNQFCKKDIYDAEAIQQRINQAAQVKQSLEADVFERDSKINASADYRKGLLK